MGVRLLAESERSLRSGQVAIVAAMTEAERGAEARLVAELSALRGVATAQREQLHALAQRSEARGF